MSDEEDDNELSMQAAIEGEETLANYVDKSEADFAAHLDATLASTAAVYAMAERTISVARLFSSLSFLVTIATLLGIVEGIHLMWHFW